MASGRLDARKPFRYSAHVGPVIRPYRRKRPAVFEGAMFVQQHGEPAIECVQALGGFTHADNLRPSLVRRLFDTAHRENGAPRRAAMRGSVAAGWYARGEILAIVTEEQAQAWLDEQGTRDPGIVG